jgi:cytochrome b
VACFFTAWLTEGSPMWLHKSAGYGVAIVLGFRLLWGFIGTRHARFADFLYPPREAIAYLKGLVAGRPRHYLGHNPAGGLMVVALLLALAGTAGTGMALYDANSGKGPVAAVRVWLNEAPPAPGARHKRDKKVAHFWEDLHEFFANATMLLVALHIGGVVVSSLAHDENLVRAMITGRKKVP